MERYGCESLVSFNHFADKIKPTSIKMQIAFDRAVVNCFTFFVSVDSKFSQENLECIRKSLDPHGDKIVAAGASARFWPARLQLSAGGQGCVVVVPDELISEAQFSHGCNLCLPFHFIPWITD